MNSLIAISRPAVGLLKRIPFHTTRVCAVICVIAILSSVIPPEIVGAQTGTTIVIHFDPPDFSDGQVVTSISGVTFPSSPIIFSPKSVTTFSPPLALHSAQTCEDKECTNHASQLSMEFDQDVSEVSLRVGNDETSAADKFCFTEASTCPAYARLLGFNADGVIVADSGDIFVTDVQANDLYLAPVTTEITIKSPAANIRSATLYSGTNPFPDPSAWPMRVQIDELTYILLSSPKPTAPAPPTVTLTSPQPGQSFAYPYQISAVGNVTALGGLVAFCTSINKPAIPINDCHQRSLIQSDGSFNFAVTDIGSPERTNNIMYAFAYDSFGQLGKTQIPITFGTPPVPTIQIFAPEEGKQYSPAWGSWSTPFWHVEISAPGGLVAFCMRADEAAIPPLDQCTSGFVNRGSYGWYVSPIEPSSLKLAENNFYAFAYDRWGQTAVASVRFGMPTDLRITAMEITQGIQSEQIPLNTSGAERYSGATLVHNAKTVVRVFVNSVAAGRYPYSASVTLCSTVNWVVETKVYKNHPVCIASDNKSVQIQAGGSEPTSAERSDPNAAYVFTIPPSWHFPDDQPVYLTAKISSLDRPECSGCSENNTFTVTGISFVYRDPITISPVEVIWTDTDGNVQRPHAPSDVFARTAAISPLPEGGLLVNPYAGTIDVTDLITDNMCDDYCRNKIFDRVASFEIRNLPGYTIGVSSGLDIGLEAPVTYARCCTGLTWEPIAIVDEIAGEGNRPLTTVTHEFYHQLAYYHAGMSCPPGFPTISWPPDDRGRIQGIGLDRRPDSGPVPGTYRIIAPGARGQPAEYVDLMSYCIDGAHWLPDNGDYNAWISLRNWNTFGGPWPNGLVPSDTLPPPEEGQVGAAAASLKATNQQTLRLIATTNGTDQVRILTVQPGIGEWITDYAESPYQVVVLDEERVEISRYYLTPITGHIHDNNGISMFTVLSGEVPAEGAAQLEITYNNQIVATRTRSANKPVVTILSPQANDHISGTGDVALRWDTMDTDGDQLEAVVEYSADNGQTYRVLTTGVQGNQVSLPARLFTGSRQARIRITVNDGFNDGVAISDIFSAEGFPPQVQIIEPIDNLKIYSDVGLRLVGHAFDDSNQLVSDEQMHWFAGEDRIGAGSVLEGPKLPPGMYQVRLEATDAQGRIGSMMVNVEVLAVPTIPTAPTPMKWLWIAIIGVLILFTLVLIVLRRRAAR